MLMVNWASPTDAIFPEADWVSGILLPFACRSSRGDDQTEAVKQRRNSVASVQTTRSFTVQNPLYADCRAFSLAARTRPKRQVFRIPVKTRQLKKLAASWNRGRRDFPQKAHANFAQSRCRRQQI